jgi:hypothetical protein
MAYCMSVLDSSPIPASATGWITASTWCIRRSGISLGPTVPVGTFIARRNITLPMFIVGYLLGFAPQTFYPVTAWQIPTALYHGVRTFWILAIEREPLTKAVVLLAMMACTGCARYAPQPTANAPFLARAATQTRDGLRVAVAVPSDEESERLFGVPLAAEGIQPVWLEVENGTDRPYWFLPLSLDPAYFTPLEAANRVRYRFSARANEAMHAHFLASAMPLYAGPTQRIAGWVFTNLDQGVKAVIVELLGPPRIEEFVFMVPIPGLHADYHEVDHATLYGRDQVRDVDEGALRAALAAMPCCATTEDGRAIEDPLNFVLIGAADEITPNLVRAGWHVTEVLKRRSALKTFWSYFFGSQYRYAPISPIYVFGRRQELSLQKARETARQRNHLRIWRAPLRFDGKPVWIGQISRDIGLSYNGKNIVGHEVDPDVDEARNYLVQDMLRSQRLTRFGWVKGVGESPPSAPRHMEDGTPFFTDGLRAVMMFTTARTPLERIRLFEWEKPPPR